MRSKAPRLMYLAELYDPEYPKANFWIWGSSDMPNDLSQIIDNFENEILDQVPTIHGSNEARMFPFVENQFYELHEAGIKTIVRLKKYYSMGSKE